MSLQAEIVKWEEDRINALIVSYRQKGFEASGNWAKSLEYDNTFTNTKINLKILAAHYSFWMVEGRQPTPPGAPKSTPPLVEIIRKWIDDKKITPRDMTKDQLAYVITRKIHNVGYGTSLNRKGNTYKSRGPRENLVTDAINRQSINKLFDIIQKDFIQQLQINFQKTFSRGSN